MNDSKIIAAILAVCTLVSATTVAADEVSDKSKATATGTAEYAPPSAYLDTLKSVLTGSWSGRFTNGTFEEPTEWMPVRVEYHVTSGGTAIVEDYFNNNSEDATMTTVYYKDNGNLRLTHYCGAQNHPRMIARSVDPEGRQVVFDFTDITNLATADSYHSRQLALRLVTDDHIQIQYHGLQNGKIYSQAYDLRRDPQ